MATPIFFRLYPSCQCVEVVLQKKEQAMFTAMKWVFLALLAGFVWLLSNIIEEYFRPYQKIKIRAR